MADDPKDRRKHPRVPVNLLVRVKYEQVDEFMVHFATNVSPGGIFLQSRTPHKEGTRLRFEIRLKGGQTVLRGEGKVAWNQGPADGEDTPQVPGMGVKFTALDEASKALIKKILEIKTGKKAIREVPKKAPPKPPPEPKPKPTPKTRAAADTEPESEDVDIDIDVDEEEPADDLDALDMAVEAPAPESAPTVEVGGGLQAEEGTGGEVDVDVDIEEPDEFDVDISVDDFVEPAADQVKDARPPTGGVSSRVIGIDLGTTNSCAAVVQDGKPQVIPSRKGYRTIPSIVAYADDGRLLVGHSAKAQMELNPRNTVYGSKRLIGRPFDSQAVQQMKSRFHYEIIEGPSHEVAVRIVEKNFSLQQVAALILTEIRDIARELLKEEVNRAVITVPAYFNENQREAVREAGILAGLQVERIINEPTAAALAFGYDRGLDQRVLVYDLGGGTFDATVLELCGNVYEVVSTGGDTFLGGVDFDNQLVDYLLDAFCRDHGAVPELDRAAMQRLREAAEQAKCALSEKTETIVRIPFFAAIENTPKDLEVRVTRSLLEDMVTPLVERTMLVAMNVLEQAKLRPEQIKNILLVGGQSRMPLIWRRIKELFGRDPHKGVHPDEAVAIGAALLADSQGKIDSVVLIDVLPVSIGLGIPGGRFLRVLESGTALPTTKTYTIRTYKDDQEELELAVFQGESDRVVDNEYLGTVTISGITKAPKGDVRLEITFSLNQECLLKVSSRELGTGKITETQMTVKDTDDIIRKKLKIPDTEISMRKYGVPRSLRKAGKQPPKEEKKEEKPAEEEKPKEKGGLLGKLFGRKK